MSEAIFEGSHRRWRRGPKIRLPRTSASPARSRTPRGRSDLIQLEIFGHDEEDIDILRRRLGGNETAPNENSKQLSGLIGEIEQNVKAAGEPDPPGYPRAEARAKLLRCHNINACRQLSCRRELWQHSTHYGRRRIYFCSICNAVNF